VSVMQCLLQCDQIYVIVRHEDDHLTRTRTLLEDLRARSGVEAKAKVILTAVAKTLAPVVAEAEEKLGQRVNYVLRWIANSEVVEAVDGEPFVLRRPMDTYSLVVRRMARELGNTLVGLALGTGAARGLAHIGVIRVLEREGIAIDVVAGSSMGALVAAAWAVGKSADEMEEIAQQIRSKRALFRLLDPVFPGSGMFRGLKVKEFLREIVDELTFADTLIPLKIIASELNTMEQIVFEDGLLLDAIRASITIPGVLRPVMNNGHVLVDGGITEPVPVDTLAHAGVSKIIAVNTIPDIEQMKQRAERAASKKERSGKMREVGPLVDTPTSIINIYMRSMHVMQSRIAEDACARADVVIRPIVPDGVWYDFYHPERYIRCGEETTVAALPQLKELVPA